MRRLLINLLIVCGSFAAALVAGEFVARFYFSYQDRLLREKNQENILTQVTKQDLFAPVKPGSFANKPHARMHWWGLDVRTDALGCRAGVPAPKDAQAILLLGDSMTFGLGLADSLTIPSLVQVGLNAARRDHPARIYNASVIGYDFQQYLYALRRLGPQIKPRLILVGLCYNDLLPNEDPFGNVMAERRNPEPEEIAEAAVIADEQFSVIARAKQTLEKTALYLLLRQSGINELLAGNEFRTVDPATLASLEQAPALVDQFIAEVERIGAPVAFVYFPVVEALGQESNLVYVPLLRERGYPVLDLSFAEDLTVDDYFLRESRGYMMPDLHFNYAGSVKVSAEVVSWLVNEGIW